MIQALYVLLYRCGDATVHRRLSEAAKWLDRASVCAPVWRDVLVAMHPERDVTNATHAHQCKEACRSTATGRCFGCRRPRADPHPILPMCLCYRCKHRRRFRLCSSSYLCQLGLSLDTYAHLPRVSCPLPSRWNKLNLLLSTHDLFDSRYPVRGYTRNVMATHFFWHDHVRDIRDARTEDNLAQERRMVARIGDLMLFPDYVDATLRWVRGASEAPDFAERVQVRGREIDPDFALGSPLHVNTLVRAVRDLAPHADVKPFADAHNRSFRVAADLRLPRHRAEVRNGHACHLCRRAFEEGEACSELECGHVFHEGCVHSFVHDLCGTCPACTQASSCSMPTTSALPAATETVLATSVASCRSSLSQRS